MHTILSELFSVADRWPSAGRVHQYGEVWHNQTEAPLLAFSLGTTDPTAPVLGLVGGIHGLERIGSEVALAIQNQLIARYEWDRSLRMQLEHMRLIFFPVVNPIGMIHLTRSNGNGVDLMRNAPIESHEASFLVGGHHYSPRLPWYRGDPPHTADRMERELKALERFIREQVSGSRCAVIVDLHSGFGLQDQLWFPFAKSSELFPRLHQVIALKKLLDEALPHHVYRFEPQSKHYRTHGDLWDYLLLEQLADPARRESTFLPLTLEMGSWSWIRKNPWQLLSSRGPFNPIKPHRHKRILRRHLPLYDFLCSAVLSPEAWTLGSEILAAKNEPLIQEWYPARLGSGSPAQR